MLLKNAQRASGSGCATEGRTAIPVHFHCCVIDGVFTAGEDGQVRFAEAGVLTPEDLAAVQQQVRARVLRWFAREGTGRAHLPTRSGPGTWPPAVGPGARAAGQLG
jgi:hypothetical protein